jgi:hypothetical protein
MGQDVFLKIDLHAGRGCSLGCKLHISLERAGILGDTFFGTAPCYFFPAAANFVLGKPKKKQGESLGQFPNFIAAQTAKFITFVATSRKVACLII